MNTMTELKKKKKMHVYSFVSFTYSTQSLENIVGKGENAGFSTMFSTLLETNFNS